MSRPETKQLNSKGLKRENSTTFLQKEIQYIWYPVSEYHYSIVVLGACNWKINLPATGIDAEHRCSDTTCIDTDLRDRGKERILPETLAKGILSAPQFHQNRKNNVYSVSSA